MTYNIKLDSFEGPFDLLVYLIEKEKVDIYDIPIAHITNQYLDYMAMLEKVNLDVMSEFLLLAATLIEIKSKMLLPKAKNENQGVEVLEEDPRLMLVEKILEYKKFKNMAEYFKEKEEESQKIKYKVQEDLDSYIEDYDKEYIHIDVDDFVKAFNLFLEKRKKIYDIRQRYEIIEGEKISAEEKAKDIKAMFKKKNEIKFYALLDDIYDRYELIVTFNIILELIKQRFFTVKQTSLFGDILLIKSRGEEINGH